LVVYSTNSELPISCGGATEQLTANPNGENGGSDLSEPVRNQLITRVGWNESSVGLVANFVDGSGKRAERVNGIVLVFAFNPVRHGLLDERVFVNSVHSISEVFAFYF
jgi:hypothetical protein